MRKAMIALGLLVGAMPLAVVISIITFQIISGIGFETTPKAEFKFAYGYLCGLIAFWVAR